ncbi:linear amide C-N hydrolase [Vibrio neptunius]|uniref:Linear amide C-N hydrolase n=1 Tax=Vibrio neptunius TaxID=170651 RepID=A0ABS3A811_9VIBR|nr:linear amide C-N hydrolase [Vibrio neptunius]MBN3495796.1 linear amide C-N hydrolase [Vibrio neptunius]MBN3518208.1 linear amide C-N hydrolase [Vibrio neptunius]MBN3551195.1 linear amide C-N hydrolase [Vibrio neptunius]MBN3580611.1 linear amide C-N hydrolase [Vibrio neptunius]MCH9874277.1 linear amide C-N hydrolase [Vibrio neptunius]
MCTDFNINFGCNNLPLTLSARTMEFAVNLQTEVWFRAKQNFQITTLTTSGKADRVFNGQPPECHNYQHEFKASWKGALSFIHCNGVTQYNNPLITSDGINESGLSVGSLYLPILNKNIPTSRIPDEAFALGSSLLGTFILSTFTTVEDMVSYFTTHPVYVFNSTISTGESEGDNMPLDQHFVIHDANSDSAVIEFINGNMHIYRSFKEGETVNQQSRYQCVEYKFDDYKVIVDHSYVGVMTNCPNYHWHVNHLSYFSNLRNYNPQPDKDVSMQRHVQVPGPLQTVNGAGLKGLPADPTPPSRFVQTYAIKQLSEQPIHFDEAFSLAQKLLNRVDIPLGIMANDLHTSDNPEVFFSDITQWSVIRNNSYHSPALYLRTYGDMTWRVANVKDYMGLDRDCQISSVLQLMPTTKALPFEQVESRPTVKIA